MYTQTLLPVFCFVVVASPCRANLVIQCENWWSLAKQFASRSPPLNFLSSPVQRALMKALVLGGFAHMDTEAKQQYWTEVTVPFTSTASLMSPCGASSVCTGQWRRSFSGVFPSCCAGWSVGSVPCAGVRTWVTVGVLPFSTFAQLQGG